MGEESVSNDVLEQQPETKMLDDAPKNVLAASLAANINPQVRSNLAIAQKLVLGASEVQWSFATNSFVAFMWYCVIRSYSRQYISCFIHQLKHAEAFIPHALLLQNRIQEMIDMQRRIYTNWIDQQKKLLGANDEEQKRAQIQLIQQQIQRDYAKLAQSLKQELISGLNSSVDKVQVRAVLIKTHGAGGR